MHMLLWCVQRICRRRQQIHPMATSNAKENTNIVSIVWIIMHTHTHISRAWVVLIQLYSVCCSDVTFICSICVCVRESDCSICSSFRFFLLVIIALHCMGPQTIYRTLVFGDYVSFSCLIYSIWFLRVCAFAIFARPKSNAETIPRTYNTLDIELIFYLAAAAAAALLDINRWIVRQC